ncbi:hypothetical protein RDI58_007256 [Solanum bulbocastanum]|uniref:DDE Tnp4 domain-containing protein n=1 Tax=Solanum bulbocastanum TaxID=147425 RepID=A0AAN8TSH9_SOLBU
MIGCSYHTHHHASSSKQPLRERMWSMIGMKFVQNANEQDQVQTKRLKWKTEHGIKMEAIPMKAIISSEKPPESAKSAPKRGAFWFLLGELFSSGIDCVGAIDEAYIEVEVPKAVQQAYHNLKGKTSQNVICVCDFDMRFTFVVAGWEGTVHDSKVLENALVEPTSQFPFPPHDNFKLHP